MLANDPHMGHAMRIYKNGMETYDANECRQHCADDPTCSAYSYFDTPMGSVSGCVMTNLQNGFLTTRGEPPVEYFLESASGRDTFVKTYWKELLFNARPLEYREALAKGRRLLR